MKSNLPDHLQPLNEVILTRLKVAARLGLPRYVADHADAKEIADEIADQLIYQLRSEVLGQRHDTQKAHGSLVVKFDMPASRWQHFKQQYRMTWWLRWLVKRRPVQVTIHSRIGYAKFDIERYRTFPDASIRFPDNLGAPVYVLAPQQMQWEVSGEGL